MIEGMDKGPCPYGTYFDQGTQKCDHCNDICRDADKQRTTDDCWKKCGSFYTDEMQRHDKDSVAGSNNMAVWHYVIIGLGIVSFIMLIIIVAIFHKRFFRWCVALKKRRLTTRTTNPDVEKPESSIEMETMQPSSELLLPKENKNQVNKPAIVEPPKDDPDNNLIHIATTAGKSRSLVRQPDPYCASHAEQAIGSASTSPD